MDESIGQDVRDFEDAELRTQTKSDTQSVLRQSNPEINVTKTYKLTPATPGKIKVQVEYEIPNSFPKKERLSGNYPCKATVASKTGFTKKSKSGTSNCYKLVWDGSTRKPSFTVQIPVDEKNNQEYEFKDQGPWALFRRPAIFTQNSLGWNYSKNVKANFGYLGEYMAFMGDFSTTNVSGFDQDITLIVPDAAKLGPTESSIAKALEQSSNMLYTSGRTDELLIFVAPDPIRDGGLTIFKNVWIKDSSQLNTPGSVWHYHYYRTRRAYFLDSDMLWFDEASAEYYSGFLPLLQDRISFSRFERFLSRGQSYNNVVLSQKSTWNNTEADGEKGALVLGLLDVRIREATNNDRSLQDVVRRMNRNPKKIDVQEFSNILKNVTGKSFNGFISTYISSSGVPSPPDKTAYNNYFDKPRVFVGSVGNGTEVKKGDTTEINATLLNAGSKDSNQEVVLNIGGNEIDRKSVNVKSGGKKKVSLSLGTGNLSPGTHSFEVSTDKYTRTGTLNVTTPVNASFTYSPRIPTKGQKIQFQDLSNSKAGQITSWRWRFGDGTSSTKQNPTHSYNRKGRFRVSLEVTDSQGYKDIYTTNVVIPRDEWTNVYNYEGRVSSVSQTTNGYVLSGYFNGSDIAGIDSDGNLMWVKEYIDEFRGDVYQHVRTSDGYVVVGGRLKNGYLFKVGTNRVVRWDKRLTTGEKLEVISKTDSGYILLGTAGNGAWVVEVDSSGNVVWEETYKSFTELNDVIRTEQNGYLVVGKKTTNTGVREWAVKLDKNGDEVWNRTYDKGRLKGVAPTGNLSYILGGESGILKVNDTGHQVWRKQQNKNVNDVERVGYVGYALAGSFSGGSADGTDAWLGMVGQKGQTKWERLRGGGGYDTFLTVTRTNKSFVAAGKNSNSPFVSKISWSVGNVPPNADFSYLPPSPGKGDQIQFRDESVDFEGGVDSWEWDFGDGTTSTKRNPTHTYTSTGTYRVGLTVTDDEGKTDTVERTVRVGSQSNSSVPKVIANLKTQDDVVNFPELQEAIRFWTLDKKVPGTNKKIDFSMLQTLIKYWSLNTKL